MAQRGSPRTPVMWDLPPWHVCDRCPRAVLWDGTIEERGSKKTDSRVGHQGQGQSCSSGSQSAWAPCPPGCPPGRPQQPSFKHHVGAASGGQTDSHGCPGAFCPMISLLLGWAWGGWGPIPTAAQPPPSGGTLGGAALDFPPEQSQAPWGWVGGTGTCHPHSQTA